MKNLISKKNRLLFVIAENEISNERFKKFILIIINKQII